MPDVGKNDEKGGMYVRKMKTGWISDYLSTYGNF